MAIAPEVTVVIPCRNEVASIEACLLSVLDLQEPLGGFEVVVADGMSDDGTREIVERIAARDLRVRLVDNAARATPGGLNEGIRSARGQIVVRMDAHTEYAPNYLVNCVETLKSTGADNVGGPWVARGNTYKQRAIALCFHSPFAVGGARSHRSDYTGAVDSVYLGCWNREIFDHIGLFDEELVRNQDDEFNFRLLRAGGTIWQSSAINSWYTPRGSLRDLVRQYWQYGYWKVRVIQKHNCPASWRHLVPGAFVTALGLLALSAPFWTPARLGLLALALMYLVAVLLATGKTVRDSRWIYCPILPAVFACFHLGYGIGFLVGFWDFVICRRAVGRFVAITRP